MSKHRKRTGGLSLPWEKEGSWLRRTFAASRFRATVVLLLVATGAFFVYRHSVRSEEERQTRAAIDQVHRALRVFRAVMGRCPENNTELVHPPRAAARYLRRMPTDAWGHELHVECKNDDPSAELIVMSPGPSGSLFVDDNIY